MKFGVEIPQSKLDALETRAHRLTVDVDRATSSSSDRSVRETAGQLVDRILEWVEEIKELREVGDEDVMERMRSFEARLSLAEREVARWPKPSDPANGAPSRRRRKRRQANAA
ncbi:MAG: hypothetical protein AAFU79_35940 [Myxococcota bacterium]